MRVDDRQEGVRRVMRVDDRREVNPGMRVDARQEVSQGMQAGDRREVNQETQVDDHQEVNQGTQVGDPQEVNQGTQVDDHQEASHRVMQEAGRQVVTAMQVDVRRVAMAVAARKVAVAVPRVEERAEEAEEVEVTGNRISAVNPCNGTAGQGSGAGQGASTRLSLIRVPQRREARAEPV